MADPDQETGLLDGTVSHALSDDSGMADNTHVQTDHDRMNEELLRQALAEAHGFDSSEISYAVASDETEVCDTGQESAGVNSGLVVPPSRNGTETHLTSVNETALVHSTESILTSSSETVFTNGTDSLLSKASEILEAEANGTYTVDVGSLPEGHIISLPNDIMQGSVIISQSNEEQLPHVVEGNEETQLLQDETHQLVQYVQEGDTQLLQTESESQLIQGEHFSQPQAITVSAPSGIPMTQEVLQSVIEQVQAQQLAQQQAAQKKGSPNSSSSATQDTVSFTLVSPSHNANAPPLGSSQNPIRIIQQGNRYTPMQQLTPDQLQQIMQVVQQQHVNKNTQENGGAVIFNPQTNTRIMYRVIYPSELHKSQNSAGHTTYQVVRPSTSSQEQQTATSQQKRPYRKRKDMATVSATPGENEDKDKNGPDGPELSKEEKEERKKHRPRTRSGRVSKPPKHMVQDYKHIHVLDWDEDYDDSDGGYSDFKHSDEEGKNKPEGEEEISASPEFFPALGAGKPKNHKCQTCDKSYIGQAGLARHYRLNPDHCTNPSEISLSLHNGSLDGDDSKDASLLQDGNSRMSDSAAEVAKVSCNSHENFSEDSNTQDSLNSTGATSPVVRRGRGRGRYRGRWSHLKYSTQQRKINKLKELMKQCTDEDLMETVLPRLTSSISTWEYLMMKSEKGGARPQVDVIYREFETLTHLVKKACADYLQPLSQEELEDDSLQCKMIKVADKSLALCLGLEPVTYRVKEMPVGDTNSFSSLHNKITAAAIVPPTSLDDPTTALAKLMAVETQNSASSGGVKRPAYVTSPDQVENPSKRARITTLASQPSWNFAQPVQSQTTSATTFTVTAQLPSAVEGSVNFTRSDSSLSSSSSSSVSSQSQSSLARVQSSTSSLLPSSQNSTTSSVKSVPTSNTVRSPYVHISCPTVKQQQPVSYILASPKGQNTANNRVNKTQPVPVVINQSVGNGGPSAQATTFIVGSSNNSAAGQQQKVLIAPSGPVNQQVPLPATAATPNLLSTNSTVLLSSGSPTTGHRVIVRQPTQPVHPQSQTLLVNQPSHSKSQSNNSGTQAVNTITTTQNSTQNTSRSLFSVMKPIEVKVSRQLFHDTTFPSTPLTNGRSNNKTNSFPSSTLSSVFQQLPTVNSGASSSNSSILVTGNGIDNGKQVFSKTGSNKTLVTPPSGQQFITSPNKTAEGIQTEVNDADIDDIAVLSTIEFSGDDLGPLNTSTESLNGATNGSTNNLTNSVVTDMAATSGVSGSVSQAADGTKGSVTRVAMAHAVTSDPQSFEVIQNGNMNGSGGITTLLNGSSSEFPTLTSPSVKANDSSINNHTSSLASSISSASSFINSSASDFINITKPSSSILSSTSKDTLNTQQSTTYHIGTNGALSNHGLKSDTNPSSSILMTDIPGFSFAGQEPLSSVADASNGQLNGISSILQGDEEPPETAMNTILTDPIQESQILDSGETVLTDSSLTGGEDGQLLLAEGTSIFQTEDGTLIIQSANGSTYQLHGAQGLPLETVQALLSGNLDQLAGEVAGEGIQTDVQLH